jgi:hypothetical protein
MIISIILVLLGCAFFLFLLRAARGHTTTLVTRVEDLQGHTLPVDLAAFRNLIDPTEEDFLRLNLPPAEFKTIQRERMRAAIEYVHSTAYNAAILLRLGEAAQQNPDAAIAEAGRQLVSSALRLRAYAFLALLRLYPAFALPGVHISSLPVIDRYQQLTDAVARFTRLHQPGQVTRISSYL